MREADCKQKKGARPHMFPRFFSLPLPYFRCFSSAELEKLKIGICPQCMEDHWGSIYNDEGIEIYRSWSGVQWYRLKPHSRDADGFTVCIWVSLLPRNWFLTPLLPLNFLFLPLHYLLVGMLLRDLFEDIKYSR